MLVLQDYIMLFTTSIFVSMGWFIQDLPDMIQPLVTLIAALASAYAVIMTSKGKISMAEAEKQSQLLDERVNSLTASLEYERELRQKIDGELDRERELRINLEKELGKERELREKMEIIFKEQKSKVDNFILEIKAKNELIETLKKKLKDETN